MNPSATLGDLYDAIDAFAPFAAARPSDNCGIVAGSRSKPLHRVLLALDVMDTDAFAEGAALAAKADNAEAAALLADAEHKKRAAAPQKKRYDFDF